MRKAGFSPPGKTVLSETRKLFAGVGWCRRNIEGSQTLTFYKFKSSNIQEKKPVQAGHLTIVQAKDQFILGTVSGTAGVRHSLATTC